VKAREFLAHKNLEAELRNVVKEPLTAAELLALAKRVEGGLRALVAPKRRAEAEDVPDSQLAAWIAADGGRVRRPIIDTGGSRVALGFTASVREALEVEL
jgi:arsenate reductase-like glutaredoxin family protein